MADLISVKDFNELIMFRQPARVKSDKGQVKETWSDYRKALVKIVESGNDEKEEGERMNLPGVLTISGHYDSGVKNTFRIIWNTVEYNIISIAPIQNRRFMILRADRVFD